MVYTHEYCILFFNYIINISSVIKLPFIHSSNIFCTYRLAQAPDMTLAELWVASSVYREHREGRGSVWATPASSKGDTVPSLGDAEYLLNEWMSQYVLSYSSKTCFLQNLCLLFPMSSLSNCFPDSSYSSVRSPTVEIRSNTSRTNLINLSDILCLVSLDQNQTFFKPIIPLFL